MQELKLLEVPVCAILTPDSDEYEVDPVMSACHKPHKQYSLHSGPVTTPIYHYQIPAKRPLVITPYTPLPVPPPTPITVTATLEIIIN